MRLVVYALQFQGQTTPGGVDGNALSALSHATGAMYASPGMPDVPDDRWAPGWGTDARQETALTFTGATTFQVASAITFGHGSDEVHLQTAGSGYLDPDTGEDCMFGAAISWFECGDGPLAGASGVITSNFIVTGSGELTEYHMGVVRLSSSPVGTDGE